MTVKIILTEPNKLLRQISQPVDHVGENEQKLMDDMIETMYAAKGIGLAAIQIGFPKRIIVMDISKDPKKKILCILLIQLFLIKLQNNQLMKKVVYPFQINLQKLTDPINAVSYTHLTLPTKA